MKTKFLELAVRHGQLELVKWMRAQQPPCPYDFWKCWLMAKDKGGTMRDYFKRGREMGWDLVRKCESRFMSAAQMASIVTLIDEGADVNAERSGRWTPLHMACWNGHAAVVALLLNKGATVHAKTNDGLMPLHCACRKGHKDVAAMLLEKGANVNAMGKNMFTSLQWACMYGHADVAEMLRGEMLRRTGPSNRPRTLT
jgi:hypothetical protein